MEIKQIKEQLSIAAVLTHYHLKPDKNNMLNCPFHEDKTPSMQVYPETNTVFCFSSNCQLNGKAIDQIDFIFHKEGCNKHEAIEKAKQLAHPGYKSPGHVIDTLENPGRIAVLTQLMQEAKESLRRSSRAKAYCEARGLNPEKLNAAGLPVGFLAERFYHSWNDQLKQSAIAIGLLKELKNKNVSPVFRNCLVFGIKNKAGKLVSIYGRAITSPDLPASNKTTRPSTSGGKHFYLKGKHQGLYPNYPNQKTKSIILTESIIDAATLLQEKEIIQQHNVLALYGTNGLAEEHTGAVSQLKHLEEITLWLDGDEAGHKATEKYGKLLKDTFPHIKISKVTTPEGEDINSLLIGHEPEIFTHLLAERVPVRSETNVGALLFSNENPGTPLPSAKSKADPVQENPEEQTTPVLNTTNPDKIMYQHPQLTVTIWGGIEHEHLHRLRLSLYLEHPANNSGFRDDVNLYSNRSRKNFMQDASQELSIPESELKTIMDAFTKAVEDYRLQRQAKKTLNKPEVPQLNIREQTDAINRLKNKDLINNLKAAMHKVGLIGEADNGLLLFLIFLTRFFDHPLHALVHGSSGSGKTNLLKTILSLVPEESKYITTALTENVLFRPPDKDFWKQKILMLEDLDGSYKALYPLREFMSNQAISKFVSEPTAKNGQFKQVQLEAHGPICIAGATTKDKVYEDNSNRSFLLHVDESSHHQNQILDYQNRQAAGLIDREGTAAVSHKIHNIQRMLNPKLKIINPFQPQLKLPEYVFKKLRTNTHYITLIKAITFLHQYQRERKKNERGQTYIETTLEDIALANELSKQSLLRKSDELSGQVRDFFEALKYRLKQENKDAFTAGKMREKFRMHPMKFNRRINELKSRGYLKQTGGNRKTGYEYRIIIWDDYQILQKGLTMMDEILENLWKQYPDGKYSKAVATEEKASLPAGQTGVTV